MIKAYFLLIKSVLEPVIYNCVIYSEYVVNWCWTNFWRHTLYLIIICIWGPNRVLNQNILNRLFCLVACVQHDMLHFVKLITTYRLTTIPFQRNQPQTPSWSNQTKNQHHSFLKLTGTLTMSLLGWNQATIIPLFWSSFVDLTIFTCSTS